MVTNTRQNANVVTTHFATDVRQDLVAVFQLNLNFALGSFSIVFASIGSVLLSPSTGLPESLVTGQFTGLFLLPFITDWY